MAPINVTPIILYLFISLVNSESTCENSKKEQGICVSTWDCIRQDGRRLGICAKGFIFGVCCSLSKVKSSPFESSMVNLNAPVISSVSSSLPSPSSPVVSVNTARFSFHSAHMNISSNDRSNSSQRKNESTTVSKLSMKQLMTTRPTIDPFAEIVTTIKPVRTVKVLNRDNNNSSVQMTPTSQTNRSNDSRVMSSVSRSNVKDNHNMIDNEILIDSVDKTSVTTATGQDATLTHLTCCTHNEITMNTTGTNSSSSPVVDSTSSTPVNVIVFQANYNNNNHNHDNKNTASVTSVTNAHRNVEMHNHSSTASTIESTGETVDTDNLVSMSSETTTSTPVTSTSQDITTVTLSPILNGTLSNVDEYLTSTVINDNSSVIGGDETTVSMILPENETIDTVTQVEIGGTSATVTDSTTTVTPSSSSSSSSSIVPSVVAINKGKIPHNNQTNHTRVSTDRPYVSHLDCGVRPLNPYARVVGGRNAQFGEWPWQVLIKESTWLGLFVKTKCGGVLVDHKWVLTAAHCRPGFLGKLVVIVGEYDLTGDFEKLKPVVKQVKRMVVHRDYNPETFENDIALLELESKFEVQPHVIPICLPEATSREEYVGKIGHVAGWGKLSFGGPVPSILQVVKLPVIPNSQCQRMFLTAGHHKIIRNTFLCAGYNDGGKDSCEGDSGGPLMIQEEDGRWTLIGTVSHGIKCAEPNLPGVYMRTSAYRPWIDSIIRSDSHTYKSYTTVNVA